MDSSWQAQRAWDKLLPEPPPTVLASQKVTVADILRGPRTGELHSGKLDARGSRAAAYCAGVHAGGGAQAGKSKCLEKHANRSTSCCGCIPMRRKPARFPWGSMRPMGLAAARRWNVSFDGAGDKYAKADRDSAEQTGRGKIYDHGIRQTRRRKILHISRAAALACRRSSGASLRNAWCMPSI